ncbi:MAG TPA: pyridoxal phosphate-dependent aminotransferase family protein [Verrucomicrobiae bacterium]|jgi:7-keto-8-aminopelargonate synthetase-like enzyme|nr:pyridoxal phosphate-dependent aminotransferase family protein [Verrucomicrobiae bacterium]
MEPAPLQQLRRTYVRFEGKILSYFAGCDYFRLSSHPQVQKALVTGLEKYGASVSASRLTTGNHILYGKVEAALRHFFDSPAALVVANGYATNLVAAQALAGEFSHAFMDSRAHVSLRDAAQFLRCPVIEFSHGDPAALAEALRKAGQGIRPILLTDGMFSHDGGIAPLAHYLQVLPARGLILLDDAHGAGLLGARGRGSAEWARVPAARLIRTLTLSKAFGAYGGAILCSAAWRERMVSRSRMFVGSTPTPLPFMNAALTSLRLLEKHPAWRARLNGNVAGLKARLRAVGYSAPETPSPIIAVTPRDARQARALRAALLARRVFPSFIQYPGGPPLGYFRFVISSEHSRAQLDSLVASLEACHD